MSEPMKSHSERVLRKGERVSLGDRVGVLRYFYGTSAAVVRFDQDATTKVVPVQRLIACGDEPSLPER